MLGKRIVLVSSSETSDYLKYFSAGLGSNIKVFQSEKDNVFGLSDQDYEELKNLGKGDAVMCVGSEPFNLLKKFYHFGIRGENYFDCSKLYRLSIEGGAFIKEIIDFPTTQIVQDFMSEDFCKPIEFPNWKGSIIHDWNRAMKFFDWIDSLPLDEPLGFDYEGSGMARDRWYEVSGFSLTTKDTGAFVSMTDIRHELGVGYTEGDGKQNQKYMQLITKLGDTILKRMDHIWVYNMQYEYQVTHRLTGKDCYNLCDASAINVMMGNHLKKLSLKWSSQYLLGVEQWDADFERLSELIDSMLFTIEGKLKAEQHKVLKVTRDNFEQTPEWKEICKRYPNYINEFKSLILEYWGNPFMCIPSDILGYYCNLDARNTLYLYLSQKDNYSQECFNTFLDNVRLSVRLGNGLYIDDTYRKQYSDYSKKQMAFGITYAATARCWMKMEKHKKKMTDIKKYHPVAQKLLSEGNFFRGDAKEIAKYLLSSNLDTMDISETGLNDGSVAMKYGDQFASDLSTALKDRMKEIKMKVKIDEGIVRKKKLLELMALDISRLLKFNKLKLGDSHVELEKYMYYERAYSELTKVSRRQLNDICNIPNEVHAFGKTWTDLKEYSQYVSDNYFKCLSPLENDEICYSMMEIYRYQTSYLAALNGSVQQLNEAENFYKSRGIGDIEQGFEEFMEEWKKWFTSQGKYQSQLYPEKVFTLALEHYQSLSKTKDKKKSEKTGKDEWIYNLSDQAKEIWSDFNGWIAQYQFFPQYIEDYKWYSQPFEPDDLKDNFRFMRKFVLNYLLYKKHYKVDSVYVGDDGMFKKTAKYVVEDEKHIPIREADPNEPGAVEKLFIRYECMQKSSKRWSSPFHTIISHSDLKNAICCPPSYDEKGNIIYNGGDFMLTYFDISSAEVKAAGYASLDPKLIDKFEKGEDVYIFSAKLYLGNKFDKLDKKTQKKWRKRFKTVFLGVLYGLGKSSLAERLDCSVEEAEDIIQGLYKSFPKLREYVESQQKYPMEHGGYINTMLGDKLKVMEYDLYLKATSDKERKNLEARIKRLGCNLPIQGGTSSIMQRGFFNNIRQSIKDGWSTQLQPIITVHDSNTNLLPTEMIFDIRKFYDTNYTEYCASFGPKIRLLFDLLAGDRYESACGMSQIDEDTIEFKGSADSLIRIYDKIMGCPKLKVSCSMKREELIPNYITDPMLRFIDENGTSIVKDKSSYSIQFRRLK